MDSPGRHMAMGSVWLTAGSILASFSIEKAIDADGNLIEPSGEYINEFLWWVFQELCPVHWMANIVYLFEKSACPFCMHFQSQISGGDGVDQL